MSGSPYVFRRRVCCSSEMLPFSRLLVATTSSRWQQGAMEREGPKSPGSNERWRSVGAVSLPVGVRTVPDRVTDEGQRFHPGPAKQACKQYIRARCLFQYGVAD